MGIKVEKLTHIYDEGLPDEQVALEDVSFEIADGQFVGVIGHTGSGKSTLLSHLNGLLKPKSGKIIIDDVDITEPHISMIDIRKRIGLVFQYPEYQLFEDTVAADVAFGPKNLGLSDEEVRDRVREAIGLVGLDYEKIAGKSPFDLSGGQKRRVAIAGVVAMKPRVLILDEPTAGLDPKAHKEVLDMIKNIHEAQGNIIILVSHNMSDIARLCEKVLVMDDGHLIMQGTPREVFDRHEELRAVGLSLPPVGEFFCELASQGVEFEKIPLEVSMGADILAARLLNK